MTAFGAQSVEDTLFIYLERDSRLMKNKSFIQRTVIMLMLQLVLLVAILLVFLYSSYQTSVENMDQILNNFIQIYGNELENKIKNGNRLLERLVYKNTEYNLLQSENESERYYASMSLHDMLQESIVNNNDVDMVVIAENNYQICLDAETSGLPVKERNAIREFALECAKEEGVKAQWNVKILSGRPYVYKMYVWHGRVAGVFLSVDSFMKTAENSNLEDITLLLTDEENHIYGCYGSDNLSLQQGERAEKNSNNDSLEKKFAVADGRLFIYSYISPGGFKGQIKSSMVVFFVTIMMSLISAFALVSYIRKAILSPMKHMKEKMDKIQGGNYQLRITENYENSEFSMLKDTFNKLMDEIIGLKIKSYEKQIELQESELKAVRLQIRPHFFLNAMTTISSLSIQKKNNEIKIYIDALSKNIRYMFKSGLHTVPLSEEIRHVENYFEMQELKYPGCVFYYIEMEPEIEEWRVPQMIIHTVIENEYKYAVSLDSMLTILIKAGKKMKDGEELLLIEIEDDGKGYPPEVLEQFDSEEENPVQDGNRVGLWSVRRTLELMYERNNLFQISNIEPHGCFNRFLIPLQPIHEISMTAYKIRLIKIRQQAEI